MQPSHESTLLLTLADAKQLMGLCQQGKLYEIDLYIENTQRLMTKSRFGRKALIASSRKCRGIQRGAAKESVCVMCIFWAGRSKSSNKSCGVDVENLTS